MENSLYFTGSIKISLLEIYKIVNIIKTHGQIFQVKELESTQVQL